MAVQKSKKSRAKRDSRRNSDSNAVANAATLSIESNTGETHIRHHMSALGYYRGKLIKPPKQKQEKEEA
jgi:large subunit ribosomal protein L32